MLELSVKSLLAYLLGSIMGSLVVGRLKGGIDIRALGSGNAGGTNALRTQGLAFALWVVIIDVGKGLLAAGVLPGFAIPGIGLDPAVDRGWLTAACAVAVVVGHVYPVWYGFRGGKGAATLVGVLLSIDALALIPLLIVWLAVVMLTGFVGLATMLAVATLPSYWMVRQEDLSPAMLAFAVAMVAFVIYTHRSNITRMRAGTENRARRLWLLRPR